MLPLFHALPPGGGRESFHWHLEICPRTGIPTGFELGAGLFVNAISPGEAAARLRDVRLDDDPKPRGSPFIDAANTRPERLQPAVGRVQFLVKIRCSASVQLSAYNIPRTKKVINVQQTAERFSGESIPDRA